VNCAQLLRTFAVTSILFCSMIQLSVGREADPKLQSRIRSNKRVHSLSVRTASVVAQDSSSTMVNITGVRLIPTVNGIEVVLEKQGTSVRSPLTKTEGNQWVAEIENAVLALPEGTTFQKLNPAPGITEVMVKQGEKQTVLVTVTGETKTPVAAVKFEEAIAKQSSPRNPDNNPDEEGEEELVVTGGQDPAYRPSTASTATKTDTPLRDIPQAIQVVPEKVIEDRNITRVSDAIQTVSGVVKEGSFGSATDNYNIRGFFTANNLRNGFSAGDNYINIDSIERVEVLKGPASVLYGQFEPGGVVNYVTKRPLSSPYYSGEFTAGSYDFYRPSIDFSGPLTKDKKLLYRLNASYETFGSFIDFVNGTIFSIAPVLSYRFSDDTTLTLEYEHSNVDRTFVDGLPPFRKALKVPINSFYGEPFNNYKLNTDSGSLTLEHRFNNNIKLRSAFSFVLNSSDGTYVRPDELDTDGQTVLRRLAAGPAYFRSFSFQNNLITQFKTGPIAHQVLLGLDLGWDTTAYDFLRTPFASIDLFNPVYGAPPVSDFETAERFKSTTNTIGIYLQDQMTLLPNLKLLIGGRYDIIDYKDRNVDLNNNGDLLSKTNYTDSAFSPRIGLVYQPVPAVSLYASYSRSFLPNPSFSSAGNNFLPPSRGTQYEVGIKGDLIKDKLSATLAAYEITKTNVPTTDVSNTDFFIATGKVKSRGIEFDLSGEPLPGWNIVASFFLNDTFVIEDNDIPIGDRLVNAPSQGASLWTTYEIQKGTLKGLGFGAGIFFVGDKEVALPNTFKIPEYLRVDASLFYKRDRWRIGLNFKNLFNERYYESQGFYLRPGEPFTVLGTVSVEF
jgi:iron complex outermembrane recepter protein